MNVKTEYTLEKHLKLICQEDPDYDILNSIWILNKQKLELGLSTIVSNFPHYSMHDASHSKTIIKNIESLLGEDRIKTLGATEAFLLLMGSYTHDIGMVLFYDTIKDEWGKKRFQEYLAWVINYSSDIDLVNAAKRVQKPLESEVSNDLHWALKVKNSVILITADYFRNKHHQRGHDYIAKDSKFKESADNFYSEQLPARFLNLLAKVAYGHGTDFYEIMNSLPYQQNGWKSDKIHPKFIVAMVRMGDYLDVDDGRFNMFSVLTLEKMPDTSAQHLQKHASVTHLLISPTSIEVTVDCPNDEVYREARRWFDGLIGEVQLLCKEWVSITPENLGGLPPVILDNNIRFLYKGEEAKADLRNLRFAISNERIFDMLEGGALYEDPDFVFLREIVQNALDASKIQLWKDILTGKYDFVLLDHLNKNREDDETITEIDQPEDYAKYIKFPSDIPKQIYAAYPIKLSVDWVDKDKEDCLEIVCEDKGTGISNDDLIRMTSHVGESRKNDTSFNELKETMPYWLKPTGAFGIGLQSLFLVTDRFCIETKTEDETEAKEIIFRSAKKGAYCSVIPFEGRKKRGAKVRLKINKDKFELSKTVPDYDEFTDTRGGDYPNAMFQYIDKQFREIDFLEVNFLDEGSLYIHSLYNEQIERKVISEAKIYDNHYKIQFLKQNNSLLFVVHENKFGSQLKFQFYESMIKDFNINYSLFIRKIHICSNSYHHFFFSLKWNLLNSDSDKTVNLSRSKVLKSKQTFLKNELNRIIKDLLIHFYDIFIDNYNNYLLQDRNKSLFHFHLIYSLLQFLKPQRNYLRFDLFGNELLPNNIAINHDGSSVSYKDFFSKENIILYDYHCYNQDDDHEIYTNNLSTVTYGDFMYLIKPYFINKHYSLKEIILLDNQSCNILYYIKNTDTERKFIAAKRNPNITLFGLFYFISTNLSLSIHTSRFTYPLDDYREICVKKGSEYKLISPFSINNNLYKVLKDIKGLDDPKDVTPYIKNKWIPILITDRLINYIVENQAEGKPITPEEIRNEYQRMLVDIYISYLNDYEIDSEEPDQTK